MLQRDLSHYEIVQKSLSGKRAADEHTCASIAVLEERLQNLHRRGRAFAAIALSPDVRRLARQQNKLAVG